jgi:hypothetical protein
MSNENSALYWMIMKVESEGIRKKGFKVCYARCQVDINLECIKNHETRSH